MRLTLVLIGLAAAKGFAHDANGRTSAPIESRRLVNPLKTNEAVLFAAGATFNKLCSRCHGEDGKSQTKLAATLPYRPTDLTNYLMQQMKDGEIYWIVSNGVDQRMPAFAKELTEPQRWELVFWVRELRVRQLYKERIQLGEFDWQLPPGFPFPKVPADNLMSAEKVELGRHLFYDTRLSLNQKQSCASCHQQSRAFTDGRGRGLGSTGELHPRGPMSLINTAYSPILTWANPNVTKLEQQALVPMFGDHPVELGLNGKEDLLAQRLKGEPRYQKLFPASFPKDADPFTVLNVTRAIAAFERTLLAGDSPYDEYRRGDDPDAISAAAKRGEALFFGERLECFHCHGGFNFTGSVDYLNKGTAEIEFHNTGLYEAKPDEHAGLYEFTRKQEDIGKFKAPSLRNIALTAPYMHDGSVKTLDAAITHYSKGGRAENPNKSEFVPGFELSARERADLLSFLESLTDAGVAVNPRWADPWRKVTGTDRSPVLPLQHRLVGEVVAVYADSVALHHSAVRGFLDAMKAPSAREFLVKDPHQLAQLKPGMKVSSGVKKRGNDYVLEQIQLRGK